MPDLEEINGNLSSQRNSRRRCHDKEKLYKNSQMSDRKVTLLKDKYNSKTFKKSKTGENIDFSDPCSSNSNHTIIAKWKKLKEEPELNLIARFQKHNTTKAVNRNCLTEIVIGKNLCLDGFKYDEGMNVYFRDEDDKVEDNYCKIKEKSNQKENESVQIRILFDKMSFSKMMKRITLIWFRLPKNQLLNSDVKFRSLIPFTLVNDLEHKSPTKLTVSEENNNISLCVEEMQDGCNKLVDSKDNIEYKTKQLGALDKSDDQIEVELMKLLLSQRHFKIKTNILVYMETNSKWHPQAIIDIPWNWLNEEKWRLHTFSQYPHGTNKSAILLAEAGFAYIGSGKGNDDRVICHFCMVIKQHWRTSDVISVVHRDLSPDCSMVTGIDCNNVPMTVPECGLNLFHQLKNSERMLTNEAKKVKTGQQIYGYGIETDSANVTGQFADQKRPGLSGQVAGSTALAHVAKPVQMADQSVMRANASISSYSQSAQASQHSSTDVQARALTSNTNTTTSSSINAVASNTNINQGAGGQENQRNRSTGTQSSVAVTGTSAHTSHVQQQIAPPAGVSSSVTAPSSSQVNEVNSTSQQNPMTPVPTATNNSTPSNISQGTSQTHGQGSTSQTNTGEAQNTARPSGRGPTYAELGIITERPKRFEYAVRAKRLESFEPWPRDHHIKKEDLADSGFYYAGYGDCARCFYCGGGLRNWEDDDNVWVEHARWFPKCAFIRQAMGQQFVDAVQDLNRDHDQITFEMVTQKIGSSAASFQLDTKNIPLKRDPAVITVLDMGYDEKDVFEAANFVKETFGVLSADKLFEKLQLEGKPRSQREVSAGSQAIRNSSDLSKDEMVMNQLKEQNNQLRQQTVCKICMDKEVAVVFLPCGHLVSCTDCAAALKDCPVCRNPVRGIVRAFMA